jgi:hypothetical protein
LPAGGSIGRSGNTKSFAGYLAEKKFRYKKYFLTIKEQYLGKSRGTTLNLYPPIEFLNNYRIF